MRVNLAPLRRKAIQRVQNARKKLVRARKGKVGKDDLGPAAAKSDQEFTAALSDDLNVSEALAAVFSLVTEVNRAEPTQTSASGALQTFQRFEDVLGCFGAEPQVEHLGVLKAILPIPEATLAGTTVPKGVMVLLEKRQAARKAKDFATADRLRDQIQEQGYKIVDTQDGARLERMS